MKRISGLRSILAIVLIFGSMPRPGLAAKQLKVRGAKKIDFDIVIIGNRDSFDKATIEQIEIVGSRLFSIYSDAFGLGYWQGIPAKIKLFEDFKAYKKYQKEVSKTTSNSGFYSGRLKEANVWRNKTPARMLSVVYHEMSHLILRKRLPRCPTWLNEGLATVFGGSTVKGRLVMAIPQKHKDRRVKSWIRNQEIMPLRKHLELSYKEWHNLRVGKEKIGYTISWSLVYFLMSSETGIDTIKRIMRELRYKKRGTFSSIEAIDRSYPGGLVALERDWHKWALKEREPLLLEAKHQMGGNTHLIRTSWGQHDKYTKYSPNNERLGCWSVALAQIAYFHRLTPKGIVSYQCTREECVIREDLGTNTFDWELFVNRFNNETSAASVSEVARYIYCASVAIQKDFGTDSYVLKKHAQQAAAIAQHYDCKTKLYDNHNYSPIQLKHLIMQEIDAQRPMMLYLRSLSQDLSDNDHAAVIDGYHAKGGRFGVHLIMRHKRIENGWYDFEKPILRYNDNNYRKIMTIKPRINETRQ